MHVHVCSVWCWSHRIGEQRRIQSELGQTGKQLVRAARGTPKAALAIYSLVSCFPELLFGPHLVKRRPGRCSRYHCCIGYALLWTPVVFLHRERRPTLSSSSVGHAEKRLIARPRRSPPPCTNLTTPQSLRHSPPQLRRILHPLPVICKTRRRSARQRLALKSRS